MAVVRPIWERRETSLRGTNMPRPGSNNEFPYHPTLLEVAQRQQELDVWEALQVGGYRFAKPGTIISCLVSAVMLFLALTPIPPNWPWNIPLVIVAIFGAVAMVVCGLLWFDTPQAGPRPEQLALVPFARAENLYLMNAQPVEPYLARCTCPGCGDESTHLVRQPVEGEPEWSTVTRQCRACGREWAQS
ncbi:hypothetical protein AWC05_25815 [Mycobacterium florentinum]|uniref:Uncharacterized protein n=1 Tax=Mycobacterium florentinum TaxID=292462 RepID=A0A1X1U443_MYCFL|nr:hypothetical protein [Mycobacterium florentinum]MCV7410818.1 hypothetical protein [Mycobacterium florentinum]ORV51610.1 hypothetical protein AWC05_25815 [Mycobacterium florentinum]BBX80152.1 hypothetical protein MFLOJ_39390 [Mycobacterium florentinum]